jgi:predicted dehydrogenase
VTYRAAIVGAGAPVARTSANLEGFSIGYSHARAYMAHPDVQLVAVADIKVENAEALAQYAGAGSSYTSLETLLADQPIDILSVCTWPTLHCEMVLAAIEGGVKMILCEKPMAVSLVEVDRMVEAAEQAGVRLFVNHQRRYEQLYVGARELVVDGVLGQLQRLEGYVGDGWDLMSWGSHWVDMARFIAGDRSVDWVFAAAASTGNVRYGHFVEDQMLLQFGFADCPIALVHTGSQTAGFGFIITGSNGTVHLTSAGASVALRTGDPSAAQAYFGEAENGPDGFTLAVQEMISATEAGTSSRIDGSSGQADTEIIMAAYQSASSRDVQCLPLQDRSMDIRAN